MNPAADARHARRAWLAHTRQELIAPAVAIREVAAMLAQDAAGHGPEALAADLGKVHAAASRLLAPLERLIDPACESAGPLDREARHELRTPLNHILGYCELWTDDDAEPLPDGFAADLHKLHALARGVLDRVDELARLAREANDPDRVAAGLPEMIRDVVESIPDPACGCRPCAGRGRVLVADDTAANRELFRRWLERDGHCVDEAADGAAALDRARAVPPDVILLDIIMPRVNGIEALSRLKADPALLHVPVVMVSALDEVDGAVRCIELGAEDYLPKPCNPVLLRARVGACLEKKFLRDREAVFLAELERERRRSDELLRGILPPEVVDELKATGTVRPRRFEGVAVFFCDIVIFTPFCDRNPPERVVEYLHRSIEAWEEIALVHQAEKVKTVGDGFMAAAGLLRRTDDHPVLHAVRCGRAMIAATRALGIGWDLRVGVHWGPVVAGVLGRQQYLFDLWGDTVNTAARMESHGVEGAITLSREAWRRVAGLARGEAHVAEVKGKGALEMVRFCEFTT